MWGDIDHTSSSFLALHLALVDQLSGLAWSRVQVWNSMTSVHQFQLGDVQLAYDVHLTDDAITTTLVVRKEEYANLVRTSLEREGEDLRLLKGTGNRFVISKQARSSDSTVEDIGLSIKNSRASLRRALVPVKSWRDTDTGLIVEYSEKAPRKDCDQIIFLFTSIRAKQHWIDFDGPNGGSLRTNRARIVFINDTFAANYTYNLALNGRTDPAKATTSFIKEYLRTHGHTAEQTILAGMSKGGTSAIVAGSGLEGCTVVALAPQLELGAYLKYAKRDQITRQLSREASLNKFRDIDTLLWEYLSTQARHWGIRQAYILTSNNDPHCTGGLWRLASYFSRQTNSRIEIHKTPSSSADSHVNTVHYLSPLFISLLGVLSSGIRPSLK
ncbi:hypothetical protein [Brevibacterium aurantiacum]|uniref:hypothetical protein n=1 Tax=Brevibacterium aurantiacum TaxID=273384 RepID=UPI001054A1DB|nr:hypothetical protein [Brevibacterium aurantiacum]